MLRDPVYGVKFLLEALSTVPLLRVKGSRTVRYDPRREWLGSVGAQGYFQSRSLEDRNRLVLFYAPLVKLVANRFATRMRSFQSVNELCSFGQFGLVDAVERFNPAGGFQFATYATTRIQGAIRPG